MKLKHAWHTLKKVTSSEAKKKTGPRRVKVIDIGRGVTDRKLVSPDRVVIAPRLVRKDSEPPDDVTEDDLFKKPIVIKSVAPEVDHGRRPPPQNGNVASKARVRTSDSTGSGLRVSNHESDVIGKDGNGNASQQVLKRHMSDPVTYDTDVSNVMSLCDDEVTSMTYVRAGEGESDAAATENEPLITISDEHRKQQQQQQQQKPLLQSNRNPNKVGSLYKCYVTPLPGANLQSMFSKFGAQYYRDATFDDDSPQRDVVSPSHDDVDGGCDVIPQYDDVDGGCDVTPQYDDVDGGCDVAFMKSLVSGQRINPFDVAHGDADDLEDDLHANSDSSLRTCDVRDAVAILQSNSCEFERSLRQASNSSSIHGCVFTINEYHNYS